MIYEFWKNKRVVVTGGAGFLGQFVVDKLKFRKCKNIFIPFHADYDLTDGHDIKKMFSDFRPEIIIHLAAVCGGIGANRENHWKIFL